VNTDALLLAKVIADWIIALTFMATCWRLWLWLNDHP